MKRILLYVFLLWMGIIDSTYAQGKSIEYLGPQSLQKARIAVSTGTTHDQFVSSHYPDATIIRTEQLIDVIPTLEAGKCDFALLDYMLAKPIVEERPHLKIVDPNIYTDGIGIAFRKEDQALCNRFNQFLKTIRENGLYDEIKGRWIDSPESAVMPTFEFSKQGKKLIIGTNSSAYPFIFIREGKLMGFDIELFNQFAAHEGLSIRYEDMSFGGLIGALASKKVDIIAASMSITPERSKQVLFSDSYFDCVSVVLALDKSKKNESSLNKGWQFPTVKPADPVKGATPIDTFLAVVGKEKVSVVEGTIQEIFLAEQLPPEQVVNIREHPDALLMLKSGNTAFTFCNIGNARSYMQQDSLLKIRYGNLLPVTCSFGFHKENNSLRQEINVFINQLKESGAIDSIYNRWMSELSNGKMPSFNFSNTDPILKVGSGCTTIPFSFISNQRYCGIDIEILSRFAQATHRRLEIVELPFSALIAAVSTHKVDLIANSLAATPERSKSIAFSDPYCLNYSVLLAKEQPSSVASERKSGFDSLKDSFINNLVVEKRYMLIINGLKETVYISLFSLLLGTLLGAAVCYLRMHTAKAVSGFAKVYISLMRGTPVLVLLMLTYYVVFADSSLTATAVAILAFALNFAAYTSEMFRSAIEGIDPGQTEAGIAMGFSKWKTFRYIIAPQAIARVLPVYKGETISLIKMTSIVGYIAVQDLTKASDIIRSRTFDAFFPLVFIAVLYFILAWLFGLGLDYLTRNFAKQR